MNPRQLKFADTDEPAGAFACRTCGKIRDDEIWSRNCCTPTPCWICGRTMVIDILPGYAYAHLTCWVGSPYSRQSGTDVIREGRWVEA